MSASTLTADLLALASVAVELRPGLARGIAPRAVVGAVLHGVGGHVHDLEKHGERVSDQNTLEYTETSFSRVSSALLNVSQEARK